MGPREWGPIFRIRGLWKVELFFWVHYFFRFLPLDIRFQATGLDRPFGDFRYGDTPWFSGYEILCQAEVGPQDKLIDLGSGRGKMVFMANLAFGCQALGVELLPVYVKVGRRIAAASGCREITFLQKDFLDIDVSTATVVFVCSAALCDETLEDLLLIVIQLRPGTRWITVGWQAQLPQLELTCQKEYLFSWGREMVYFSRVLDLDLLEGQDPEAARENGPA